MVEPVSTTALIILGLSGGAGGAAGLMLEKLLGPTLETGRSRVLHQFHPATTTPARTAIVSPAEAPVTSHFFHVVRAGYKGTFIS